MSEKAKALIDGLEQAAQDWPYDAQAYRRSALQAYIARLEETIAAGARSAAQEVGTPAESSAEGRDYWRLVTNRLDRVEGVLQKLQAQDRKDGERLDWICARVCALLEWARNDPSWLVVASRHGL